MNTKSILSLVSIMVVWGLNFSIIKIGLDTISPWLLSMGRYLFTVVPIIFFIPRPECHWKWVVLFGIFSGIFQFALLTFSIEFGMSPGLASVALQVHVFFTIILGIVFLHERITKITVTSLIIGLGGLIVLGSSKDTDTNMIAVILLSLSALSWAFSNIITKKTGDVNMFSFVIWSSLIPIFPLLFMSIYFDGWDGVVQNIESISGASIMSLLYLSYATTIFGFGLWSTMIKKHGSGTVAPFTLLVPIFGVLGGYLIFGDVLSSVETVSGILILIALGIIVFGKRYSQ